MRIASPTLTGAGSDNVTVIRGALATNSSAHDANSLIRKIKPIPIEFRRPSILRASGHTFEYLGYGPGNYSTALPQVQDRTLTEREEFLVQSQEKAGGIVVYTGMNNKGDFYIGNLKKSSATGEETTYDTPVPSVTGQDPVRLSGVYDELTVKERMVVEGGENNALLSQFDGPVTFNNTVKLNGTVNLGSILRVKDETQANSTTTGAVVVSGGVGIAKNLHVGGTITGVGATFSGTVYANKFIGDGSELSGIVIPGSDQPLHLNDNIKLTLGNTVGNPDMEIYHDTTDSIIQDSGTGALKLRSDSRIELTKVDGTTNLAIFEPNGASKLYHNGTLILETTDTSESSPKNFNGVYITGQLSVEDDIIAFATSDRRLKDNISPIKNALDKVKSISGNTFDWNEASNKEGSEVGVIAQEIDALGLPGITTIREDGTYAVRYEKLVPILIEAIKELSAKVDALS